MPIKNVIISQNSNEKQFISAFVKSIMAESIFASQHSLVCKIGSGTGYSDSTTVSNDAEVDTQLTTVYSVADKRPRIWFCIDDHIYLQLERELAVSDSITGCNFNTYFNSTTSAKSRASLKFYSGSDSQSHDTEKTRTYKYQIVSNSNVLFVVFGDTYTSFPLTSGTTYQSIFIYKKGTELAYGNAPQTNLTNQDDQPLSAVNRLPYINDFTDPTNIEVIQNKVAKASAGNNKVITMDNIWDSSYNSALMFPVNIGNNQYVYLNNYTLMPI